MAVNFPGSLFGFKKNAVINYLSNLEKQQEEALEALEAEVAELKRKNLEMMAELGQIPSLEYSLKEQAEEATKRDEKNSGIIEELKQQLSDAENRYFRIKEEMSSQSETVKEKTTALELEREKVTKILILAEEKAENLLKEAKEQIKLERLQQEEVLKDQKQQFLRFFERLQGFRLNIKALFDDFNDQLEEEETAQYNLFSATEQFDMDRSAVPEEKSVTRVDSWEDVENNIMENVER